jgi:hypothetical protein
LAALIALALGSLSYASLANASNGTKAVRAPAQATVTDDTAYRSAHCCHEVIDRIGRLRRTRCGTRSITTSRLRRPLNFSLDF